MKISTLDAKGIKMKIKNNWTINHFLAYYECSEDDLKSRLSQIYQKDPSKVAGALKAIKKNEKVRSKEEIAAAIESIPGPLDAVASQAWRPCLIVDMLEKACLTQTVEEYDLAQDSESEPEPISFEEKMRSLKEQEDKLSQKVILLEKEWFDHKSHRITCLKALRELEKKLEAIRDELADQFESFKMIAEESDEISAKMNSTRDDLKESRAALESVRAEIQAMNKVLVGITAEGEIITFDEAAPSLDDSGNETFFSEIIENEICSELRLKDIRAISRLMAIVRNASVEIEVVCDIPDVEAVFMLLSEGG